METAYLTTGYLQLMYQIYCKIDLIPKKLNIRHCVKFIKR